MAHLMYLFLTQAEPLKVVVTGAAGQISYSLLFSIAKGDVFGKDQVNIAILIYYMYLFTLSQTTAMD